VNLSTIVLIAISFVRITLSLWIIAWKGSLSKANFAYFGKYSVSNNCVTFGVGQVKLVACKKSEECPKKGIESESLGFLLEKGFLQSKWTSIKSG
jgi:hypothetical protein